MTTDPNELAQQPGTPSGQELAAVAGEQTSIIPTSGTDSAEAQQQQGDSESATSSSPTGQQPPSSSPSADAAGQSGGESLEDRVAALERWKSALDGVNYQ